VQAIQYRKASASEREHFLEYLGALQAKQAGIVVGSDYAGAIERIVTTEIVPAARDFRNKMDAIGDRLFGNIATDVATGVAAVVGSCLNLFGDLSWDTILALAAAGAVHMIKTSRDIILADRAARRECSISYILSLDDQ
jgi:hypothetical protein